MNSCLRYSDSQFSLEAEHSFHSDLRYRAHVRFLPYPAFSPYYLTNVLYKLGTHASSIIVTTSPDATFGLPTVLRCPPHFHPSHMAVTHHTFTMATRRVQLQNSPAKSLRSSSYGTTGSRKLGMDSVRGVRPSRLFNVLHVVNTSSQPGVLGRNH